MSRQARIEEISDSDPEEVDISTLPSAPTLPIATSSFTPGRNPNAPSSSPSSGNPTLVNPAQIPTQATQTQYVNSTDASTYKFFQCLYPVYFDVTRSRADGRKVDKSRAVKNPLAREIADACGSLGLRTMFEPGKTHPKDWANPGRVRVLLKLEGEGVHPVLTNS
jgi:signal recognition particle subunit SRP19